jgi:3-dehydroquinate synthase
LKVPAGEASKSRRQWARIHDWLAEQRAERGEAVIALGGGMIGDLAGFAAATYLRGMPLIQVPTSLLAQVDASIGGKVAVNHPHGKNLIGAFYPPRLVLADPAVLLTLPPRQRAEGWAEVVKAGVALDADFFVALEDQADALRTLRPRETTAAIAHSVALKAAIVEGDERDAGPRLLLNYGHTVGHAIEQATGYGQWLHGEAVAAGMAAEARLARRMGHCDDTLATRQDSLLARFDLPVRLPPVRVRDLFRAALWDKKVRGGRVRWVLPTGLGRAAVFDDVPDREVRVALFESGALAGEEHPEEQAADERAAQELEGSAKR